MSIRWNSTALGAVTTVFGGVLSLEVELVEKNKDPCSLGDLYAVRLQCVDDREPHVYKVLRQLIEQTHTGTFWSAKKAARELLLYYIQDLEEALTEVEP